MRKDLPGCLHKGNKRETPKVFLLEHGNEATEEYDGCPGEYKET
jgi:hypothetical protein